MTRKHYERSQDASSLLDAEAFVLLALLQATR